MCSYRAAGSDALRRIPYTGPKPPETAWYKPNATTEDFQRTRSGCIVTAETGSGGDMGRWLMIFPNCMRAQGWVLVPK